MPCGNGHTLSQRKHGAWVPTRALVSALLLSLLCLDEARGDAPRTCSPCPTNCTCVLAGVEPACVVNCSGIGLDGPPVAADLPQDTAVLDLSRNHITSLDGSLLEQLSHLKELYLQRNRISALPRGVFCCGSLSVLDLSNNQITTIRERVCDNLFNLTQIDLSANPYHCNCDLFRLVSWLRDKGVRVRHPEAMLCNDPPELRHQPLLNASLHTCLIYAACLEDSAPGGGSGRSELVIFSFSAQGNFSRDECNSVCYGAAHRYGGLSPGQCLCSTNSEPNLITEAQCSAACSQPRVMQECSLTLANDVFEVSFWVSLRPLPLQSVHQPSLLSATSSIRPLSLSWDFGDLSPRVNATETAVTTATHKYGLPGQYTVAMTAWAGHKEVSVHGQLTVALPAQLELHCPAAVAANQSLELLLVSWGSVGVSVDWSITREEQEATRAWPLCPEGSLYDGDTHRCFRVVPGEFSWSDARRRCSQGGGALALRHGRGLAQRLASRVACQRGAWLGLSDMHSPGTLRWEDGEAAGEGEGGAAPRVQLVPGSVCVALEQDGTTGSHLCSAGRAYVCMYSAPVPLPDGGVYMMGLAVFPSHNPLFHASLEPLPPLPTPPPLSNAIELLVFPTLSVLQAGRVSSLELLLQERSSSCHLLLQLYRPQCGPGLLLLLPGCDQPECSALAVCVPTPPSPAPSPTLCPALQQWCPFQGRCQPLASPCPPPAGPSCPPAVAHRPVYSLLAQVALVMPAGPPAHLLVRDQVDDLLVTAGDVIALQHDAGPASLMRCPASPLSPWRQAVYTLNQSLWLGQDGNASLVLDDQGVWLHDVLCPIRLLYVGNSHTQLQGAALSSGLAQPGLYSVLVQSMEPSLQANASCPVLVVPPLGLEVVDPPPLNATVYLSTTRPRLLLRVRSRYDASASLPGGAGEVPFLPSCPPGHVCPPAPPGEPSLWALLELQGPHGPGPHQVALEARSEVARERLELQVLLEEPLASLVVRPHPGLRVLVEEVVSYTASVEQGSNPTFKWTVDDKPYYTYYNTVLNIIFQNTAVFKLSVTAMNHVSRVTQVFNVTAERMQPACNLTLGGVPPVALQGAPLVLTASLLLDASVSATFRWSFGDGGYRQVEVSPPYDASLLLPDHQQVALATNVSYVYAEPGVYTLQMSVSNRHDNLSVRADVHVHCHLDRVDIQTDPPLLVAGGAAALEAHAWPVAYGVRYSWSFGDGSAPLEGRERRVNHTFTSAGVFQVCVEADNAVSRAAACALTPVYEPLASLEAGSSSPTELGAATAVWANVAAGNNVSWLFRMGDGHSYAPEEPRVAHSYIAEGNYTVNVSASNAISGLWVALPVQVVALRVLSVEPSGCLGQGGPVVLRARVTGNASALLYRWSFGDGEEETRSGDPAVTHVYTAAGTFRLALLLTGTAGSANFSALVCVQPLLGNVSLVLDRTHAAVGEQVRLRAQAEPPSDYIYQWDFDTGEPPELARGSGDMLFTYRSPGYYLPTVTVFNNISAGNASASLEVQRPVGAVLLQHNGTRGASLVLGEPYLFSTPCPDPQVRYRWDFGDGSTVPGQQVVHVFSTPGRRNVTLTASNGVSSNTSWTGVAVLTPIHGLTVNASLVNVPVNTQVQFTARAERGDDLRFSWISWICDSCTSVPESHATFYTFRSVGTFNIVVTAENEVSVAQASVLIYVQRELEGLQIVAQEPEAAGGFFPSHRTLHLHAELREGTNMSFSWSLGGASCPTVTRAGRTVDISSVSPGACEVSLRATNLLGQLSVNRTFLFLDPVGNVELRLSANPVAVGVQVLLSALAPDGLEPVGSELDFQWTVDSLAIAWSGSVVSHSFGSPGERRVAVRVSNRVSAQSAWARLAVQEEVTGLEFTASNVTEQGYAATDDVVSLCGEVATGTNVTYAWQLPGGGASAGRKASVVFPVPGMAVVALNASNGVSSQAVRRELMVQERIRGLELRAAKLASVGEPVEFTVTIAAGSNVTLILRISGDATVFLQLNQTYTHRFSRVETYMVNLTAHNQVSSKRHHLQVEVMEPVRGLTILDCCDAAIPAGVRRAFVARITTGNPIHYLWTFDLNHLDHTHHVGREPTVFYTPEVAGTLTIFLQAFNALHDQNVTRHLQVQTVVRAAALEALPGDTFVNKTVALEATLMPPAAGLSCLWELGDDSPPRTTLAPLHQHRYGRPGRYLVQVNCSNQVSWAQASVEVSVRVLECEEPEVQVVQAPHLAVWRSQPTLVEAHVDLKGCVRYGARYLWQVLAAPTCSLGGTPTRRGVPVPEVALPPEVDAGRLQLPLPKMALAAGNYTLVFSLAYQGVPLRVAACLQLSIMATRLVPIIEGGTYRVWPKTQDLQLSAEQSYDPNMDPDRQGLLHYDWACLSTSRGAELCSSLNFGLGSSGPVLGISGSELEAGVEYTFRLTVSKPGLGPESTTQTVLVQTGSIPMVMVECVSCKAQSIYEVSQNSYVYLRGSCSNCQQLIYGRWEAVTQDNETLPLDWSSTTTGGVGMNLVLRQGALQHGHSYIFTLHVADALLAGEGAASLSLRPNMPPQGGRCHLGPEGGPGGPEGGWTVTTLLQRVRFNCSGYSDLSETPLLYSLLATRCRGRYCEDFCVYRGTSAEHAAFLPPGFIAAGNRLAVCITVEDHQGATTTALNTSVKVVLPDPPPGYSSLPHWLAELTDSHLRELLKQGDSQRVRELSLALITVLNEYEQAQAWGGVSRAERGSRLAVRSNITQALTALDLSSVSDIQQTSAALAQCTAVNRHYVCEECQSSTLNKLENMLEILQGDTRQGTVTPTEIADNILNIMGDLIHQVSQASSQAYLQASYLDSSPPSPPEEGAGPEPEPLPLRVASRAFSLSSELMLILMHARVLNEEPLVLRGAEIAATGKLADPESLLCYQGNDSPECQRFSIPRAFNSSLGRTAAGIGVIQLLFQVEPNPFPFNMVANHSVSTEVASMEFRTANGTHIPVRGLAHSQAITVAVSNGSGGAEGIPPAGAVNVSRCSSVVVRVAPGNANPRAAISVLLNFTTLGGGPEGESSGERPRRGREEPYITAFLQSHPQANEYNCSDRKRITLSMTREEDHRKYTFFLSPERYDTTQDHYVNVSSPCGPGGAVRLEVGVFSSLCQYFSQRQRQWRTDGMEPLEETSAGRAVCRTHHLTAFAASLLVPPDAVAFTLPEQGGGLSLVVLLVCLLGLLCYVVAAALSHKLDQLDLRHAAVVPFCGREGPFKYEVQVKTGWNRGAGTTAHVGVSLQGTEGRSGHRHLDGRGAFARNALDIFHVATETSLGSLHRIRVWHDNKGLSPAWLLQYVLVRDVQTGSSYYFLVEDWLSVDNARTGGRVELEVEASEEALLRRWPRLLLYELQRALCDSHLWVSLWERPARTPFPRLQRATCCALLLQLCLLANTLWYATVAHRLYSWRAVSRLVSVSGETVAAGLISCVLVYPAYLLVFTLGRMSRSQSVTVEQIPAQAEQDSVEMDDFLDSSLAGSSFMFLNGLQDETNSEDTNVDLPTPSTSSGGSWSEQDEQDTEGRDWPELPEVGGAGLGAGLPRLKRGQGSRHLGVDMTFNPEEVEGEGQGNKYFTSSDEDLIKQILADGQNIFPQTDESEMADLSSILGDKTEVILLQQPIDPPLPGCNRRDPPKTAFTSTGADVCRPRRLPPWCGRAALWGSWVTIGLANVVSVWAGLGFSEDVAVMWLISCLSSFLCSCLLLEPVKVACEALYYAACVRRLRPEEQDVLVECPRVERVVQRVVQRVARVRPPQGFALCQARQQARKLHLLHRTLKDFLVYMFFLLVVLLLNYSDTSLHTHSLRLQNQLKRTLHLSEHSSLRSRQEVLVWLNQSLFPRLLDSPALLRDSGSVLLGSVRRQRVRETQGGSAVSSDLVGFSQLDVSQRVLEQTWLLTDGLWGDQLNRSLAPPTTPPQEQLAWLDYRALAVDLSLYNTNTDLLAVVSLQFSFPVSERAQSHLRLLVVHLQPITGLDLQLLLTVVLLGLLLYFLVVAVLGAWRVGAWHMLGAWHLPLALCVCTLGLIRRAAAQRLWAWHLLHPQLYTHFLPLALLGHAHTACSALLLFVLVLKASHQLRVLKEWAVFGRAMRRSAWELLSVALALLLLLLAYSHAGHLLFHSAVDGYGSVSSACLSLLRGWGRGLLPWRPTGEGPSRLAFQVSLALARLLLLWLLTSALLRSYRRARAELQRPAELQDYQMVELFLRRLKMWMGLSRTKEFRHKVRFEGMEPPPSRSSSTSDCRSLCLPPLEGLEGPEPPSPSPSPSVLAEAPVGAGPGGAEACLDRLLPSLDALLQQLDRVTMATQDLCHLEWRLERARRGRGGGGARRKAAATKLEETVAPHSCSGPVPSTSGPAPTTSDPTPSTSDHAPTTTGPSPSISGPAHKSSGLAPITTGPVPTTTDPVPSASGPAHKTPGLAQWAPPPQRQSLQASSLFNHPAHTTTIPTRKRKRKPPPLKNKVHPHPDRRVAGHPKP